MSFVSPRSERRSNSSTDPSSKYSISDKVHAPFVSPNGGLFTTETSVSMTTPTPGAEIHYTLDGSDPAAQGRPYTQPLTLKETTDLRAVVLRDGKPLIALRDTFRRGTEPRVIDPRFAASIATGNAKAKTSGAFRGPFDKELVGRWRERERIFRFGADGKFYRQDKGKERAVLETGKRGPSLSLSDEKGIARATLGVGQTETPDGKVVSYPESSLLFFGSDRKVRWQAP